MASPFIFVIVSGLNAYNTEDTLGQGSTQATTQDSDAGKDEPFWNALNRYIKNLHAVISGHGGRHQLLL